MLSSNNFCCRAGNSIGGGIGSFAFTIPKVDVYNGLGFSFGSTQVDFSTAPVSAVTDQQYFDTNGNWVTRIGRTTFCNVIPPIT